ncbi:MAG: ribonuclease P protein component [Bacteroidota bacterium]
MTASRHTFTKDERLSSRKLIEKIIAEGKSIHVSPFRLSWAVTEIKTSFPAQLAIAVPKRFFKRAVDRNRIKRLVREVYRKNKSGFYTLLQSKEKQCALLLVYNGRKVPDYDEVEKKILLTLQKFEEAILKNTG